MTSQVRRIAGARVVALVVLALGCIGCASPRPSSSSSEPACAAASVVRSQSELAALSRCTAIGGDLHIAGGATLDLSALASVEEIRGSLRLGPTLAIATLDGLQRLHTVHGDLRIEANLLASGVFLPALRRVHGSVVVRDNPALSILSLPGVEQIDGALTIARNAELAHLDASNLRLIRGALSVRRNPSLATVIAPHVSGRLEWNSPSTLPPGSDQDITKSAEPE